MSGNIPPDFAYLSETKGGAHRTSVVQNFICHVHLEDVEISVGKTRMGARGDFAAFTRACL